MPTVLPSGTTLCTLPLSACSARRQLTNDLLPFRRPSPVILLLLLLSPWPPPIPSLLVAAKACSIWIPYRRIVSPTLLKPPLPGKSSPFNHYPLFSFPSLRSTLSLSPTPPTHKSVYRLSPQTHHLSSLALSSTTSPLNYRPPSKKTTALTFNKNIKTRINPFSNHPFPFSSHYRKCRKTP
jgi:hypothetical protein